MNITKCFNRIIIISLITILLVSIVVVPSDASTTPGITKITSAVRTSETSTSIKVKWNKIASASGYVLYRSTSLNGKYVRICSTAKNTFTDTSLKTGKTYYYKVKTYKYVNSQRKYGLFSNEKSVKMMYNNPVMTIETDVMLKDSNCKDICNGSLGIMLKSSKYCQNIKVLSSVRRPFYGEKIFGRVYKNAAVGKSTKTIYYAYSPNMIPTYYVGGLSVELSTGNTDSDYSYVKLIYTSSESGFRYFGLNPMKSEDKHNEYNPKTDVIQFYVIYKDNLYSVKYDANKGLRTSKL